MHHRKQRSGSTTTLPTTRSPRPENEAMSKLRFVKKPLCLQYMLSSQCARRHHFYKSRPKEQSILVTIILCLIRLVYWLDSFIRNDVWRFLTAPATELDYISYPREDEYNQTTVKIPIRARTRSRACTRVRRDMWGNSVVSDTYDRRVYRPHLCY